MQLLIAGLPARLRGDCCCPSSRRRPAASSATPTRLALRQTLSCTAFQALGAELAQGPFNTRETLTNPLQELACQRLAFKPCAEIKGAIAGKGFCAVLWSSDIQLSEVEQ